MNEPVFEVAKQRAFWVVGASFISLCAWGCDVSSSTGVTRHMAKSEAPSSPAPATAQTPAPPVSLDEGVSEVFEQAGREVHDAQRVAAAVMGDRVSDGRKKSIGAIVDDATLIEQIGARDPEKLDSLLDRLNKKDR